LIQIDANSKHSSDDESTDMCRPVRISGHGLGSSFTVLVSPQPKVRDAG
jgi:hypothetical protein